MTRPKVTPLRMLCLVFALLLVYGQVGQADFEDAVKQETDYCKNVAIWKQNNHLPERHRPGHPAYDPSVKCKGQGHEV